MPRIFTGLEVPEAIGDDLARLRGGLLGARWVEPEDYHLTLRFVGDVDDRTANEIADLLYAVRKRAIEVTLTGLGAFGGDRPRSLFVAVKQTQPLMELQAEHERIMRRVGLAPETRKFIPTSRWPGLAATPPPARRRTGSRCARCSSPHLHRAELRAVLVEGIGRRRALPRRGELSARRLTRPLSCGRRPGWPPAAARRLPGPEPDPGPGRGRSNPWCATASCPAARAPGPARARRPRRSGPEPDRWSAPPPWCAAARGPAPAR